MRVKRSSAATVDSERAPLDIFGLVVNRLSILSCFVFFRQIRPKNTAALYAAAAPRAWRAAAQWGAIVITAH